jgi:hypothetical protein
MGGICLGKLLKGALETHDVPMAGQSQKLSQFLDRYVRLDTRKLPENIRCRDRADRSGAVTD